MTLQINEVKLVRHCARRDTHEQLNGCHCEKMGTTPSLARMTSLSPPDKTASSCGAFNTEGDGLKEEKLKELMIREMVYSGGMRRRWPIVGVWNARLPEFSAV